MNDRIKSKFDELKNDTEKMRWWKSIGFKPSISIYIPYNDDKNGNHIIVDDDSKWFVDHDEMEKHFFGFFEMDEKPDYDGVFFTPFFNEDGTYDTEHPEAGYISKDRIRRNYLFDKYNKMAKNGFEEPIEFNIHCKMKRRWADEFVSFLRYIESNGNIGHSSEVSFYADGDGDFHPKFTVDNKDIVDDLAPTKLKRDSGAAECIFDAG